MTTQTTRVSLKTRLAAALSHKPVADTASTKTTLKTLNHEVTREKPGKSQTAKKFIEKKPRARVVGAALLEELYKKKELNKLKRNGVSQAEGSDSESIAEENRRQSHRPSLRECTHRVPQITKHVEFVGSDGGECTHIYFYEATKVKLPWTGPKARNGEKEKAWQVSSTKPKLF